MAKLSDKDIIEMIFFPVVNEACRVLAEGIAVKSSDLDISAIMGMGFPPYRFLSETFFCLSIKQIPPKWTLSQEHVKRDLILLRKVFLFNKKDLSTFFARGGIIFWADTLGSKYICSRLDEWSRMYGDFFKPCSYLAERASKGAPLVSVLSSIIVICSGIHVGFEMFEPIS